MNQYQITVTVTVLVGPHISGDHAADALDEHIHNGDYAEFEVLNSTLLGVKEVPQ